jgi:hypothetical protein
MLSLGKVYEIVWKTGAVNYIYKDVVMTKCKKNMLHNRKGKDN